MHYHCEIVIPPTDDIEAAVSQVLSAFDENRRDEEDVSHPFWDWWVIGGRWAGRKLMAQFDEAKLDEFTDWLKAEKITVSGIQWGKQELSPADQIPKVDAKWNEMFGTETPCPIFKHSNGRRETLPNDVMHLENVPARLKASHVIFAGPGYDSGEWTGPLEAKFMLTDTAWNGCNHMPVDWDGKFASALDKYREDLKNSRGEYGEQMTPKADWLVVTVDYHS